MEQVPMIFGEGVTIQLTGLTGAPPTKVLNVIVDDELFSLDLEDLKDLRRRAKERAQRDPGRIYREGSETVVEIRGKGYLLKDPNVQGVTCMNADAPEPERIYQKRFINRRIYLPDEFELATTSVLNGHDVVVLGANGYSNLSPARCQAWGIQPGKYEAACKAILISTIKMIQDRFTGARIKMVHGASNMGVDRAIIEICKKLNLEMLGFSCPEYLFYVQDDNDFPVHVSSSGKEYSDRFVEALNILLACNGAEVAFRHDIAAATAKAKQIIPVNVLRAISTTGGPPAFDEHGKVVDAVAAYEHCVHMMGQRWTGQGEQDWLALLDHVHLWVANFCRTQLSPNGAFGAYNIGV